jgi:polyisoprenoid-binding protein YceI
MATNVTTATATPAAAPGSRIVWTIDSAHTGVEFAVRHLMISTVKGRFAGVAGTVIAGDDLTKAEVDITIDAASIDTREPQRDAHLRSADFLDVEEFPTLTFKSRKVEHVGGDDYKLTGDLTIHGVTRQVTLDVTTFGKLVDPWGNEKAGFNAATKIKRGDYGLVWNVALEAGGVVVGDEVKISIEVELTKQKA